MINSFLMRFFLSIAFPLFFQEFCCAQKVIYLDTIIAWGNTQYVVIEVAPKAIEFHLENDRRQKLRSFSALDSLFRIQSKQLVFAMNGGMYLPQNNNEPQGLCILDEYQRTPLDTNCYDRPLKTNFYLHPNGIFLIATDDNASVISTKEYLAQKTDQKKIKYATQSGPMLVVNNKIHPAFREFSKNKHIRNAVGVNDQGNCIFVISEGLTNFFNLASLMKHLNCRNALYLDGFVSRLYYPELNLGKYKNLNVGNFGVMIAVGEAPNK